MQLDIAARCISGRSKLFHWRGDYGFRECYLGECGWLKRVRLLFSRLHGVIQIGLVYPLLVVFLEANIQGCVRLSCLEDCYWLVMQSPRGSQGITQRQSTGSGPQTVIWPILAIN